MHRALQFATLAAFASIVMLTPAACRPSDQGHATNGSTTGAAATGETPITTGPTTETREAATAPLHVRVDLAKRQLHLMHDSSRVTSYPVAVGSARWPTEPGEWRITQVVFNPDWNPPDESWAEARVPRESGDPRNPLGRVQLVYDPPRSIHGTNEPASIGTATSHGSIRMRNDEIEALARQLMESAGAAKDEEFYRQLREQRSRKEIVTLPKPVLLVVR